MLKKFIVISFNLLFLVSTTGLPFSINFCKMTGKGRIQFCGINHNDSENSCAATCEAKNETKHQHYSRTNCCENIPLEKIITDKYVSLKTDLNNNLSFLAVVPASNIENLESLNSFTSFLEDSSPPSLYNNHIYLDNSILLI